MTDPIRDILKPLEDPVPLSAGLEDEIWNQVRKTLHRTVPSQYHDTPTISLEPAGPKPKSQRNGRLLLWAAVLALVVGGASVFLHQPDRTVSPAATCGDYTQVQDEIDRLATELTTNPFGADSRLDLLLEAYEPVLADPTIDPATVDNIQTGLTQVRGSIDNAEYQTAVERVFALAALHEQLGSSQRFDDCTP